MTKEERDWELAQMIGEGWHYVFDTKEGNPVYSKKGKHYLYEDIAKAFLSNKGKVYNASDASTEDT